MTDSREIPVDAKVFAFLFQSIEAQHRGNFPAANKLIDVALRLCGEMPSGEADGFRALGLCSLALLRKKENRPEDASKVRQEAMALVDRVSDSDATAKKLFPELMSALLMDLQEYRRAIPFCESYAAKLGC